MLPQKEQFQKDGAFYIERAVSVTDLARLEGALEASKLEGPGRRILEPSPVLLDEILKPGGLNELASDLEGEPLRPVRFLLFDKTPASNWGVGWHQDRVLPLARRHVVEGFERWTSKSGVPHVEPPAWISSKMVTLRVHIDDADLGNGPLKVILGSHHQGRLTDAAVRELVSSSPGTSFPARAGSVLALKTLAVHASDRATHPRRRRVLHVDFAPPHILPDGLDWSFDLPDRVPQ